MTATANPGFDFVDWKNNGGAVVSSDHAYTVTMNVNQSLVANFAANVRSGISTRRAGRRRHYRRWRTL